MLPLSYQCLVQCTSGMHRMTPEALSFECIVWHSPAYNALALETGARAPEANKPPQILTLRDLLFADASGWQPHMVRIFPRCHLIIFQAAFFWRGGASKEVQGEGGYLGPAFCQQENHFLYFLLQWRVFLSRVAPRLPSHSIIARWVPGTEGRNSNCSIFVVSFLSSNYFCGTTHKTKVMQINLVSPQQEQVEGNVYLGCQIERGGRSGNPRGHEPQVYSDWMKLSCYFFYHLLLAFPTLRMC